jgi:hypothetical protein
MYRHAVESNGFSLEVISSHSNSPVSIELINKASYIPLHHREEYKLLLSNNRPSKCDATVYIDNNKCGTWRINGLSSITIERPAHEARKFVFLSEKSHSASMIGASEGNSHNGLIKVVFTPEKQEFYPLSATLGERNVNMYNSFKPDKFSIQGITENSAEYYDSYDSGVTGLGSRSNVEYGKTQKIYDIDKDNVTTIYARLVIKKEDDYIDRYYKPIHSTPYPSRIDVIPPYSTPSYYHELPPPPPFEYNRIPPNMQSNARGVLF